MKLVTHWAKFGKEGKPGKERDLWKGTVRVELQGPPELLREIDQAIREKLGFPMFHPWLQTWKEVSAGLGE